MERRNFLAITAAAALSPSGVAAAAEKPERIIDTHQHLWDLQRIRLPWLEGAPDTLRHRYDLEEYREATKGLPIEAIYMEVDVADDQLDREVAYVVAASKDRNPTRAAVIGGRPGTSAFVDYLARHRANKEIRGVRRVLHSDATPPGTCRTDAFLADMKRLGEIDWSFDFCMRPQELGDARHVASQCPNTRFMLDHCGNPDLTAWQKNRVDPPKHTVDAWRKSIDDLASLPNVHCKISGVIATLPKGAGAEYLAPAIDHCLDAFGPDRVVFGGDWPVCLLGGTFQQWYAMLTEIVADRPAEDRRKLWWKNAVGFYRLA